MCNGNPVKPYGINAEGLKRLGYSSEAVLNIKRAYKIVFRQQLTLEEAVQKLFVMDSSNS